MMNISLTVISQAIIGLVIVMTLLGYYLGKRKTATPKTTAAMAGASALLPPVALIFLLVLITKDDIK
ncbi:hypothetical protein [Vibrio xiamenensis]|nr:hypothetical protein [Vibrio xiamenensis]